MQRHGWPLLFHDRVIEQLQKLNAAAQRAQESDSQGFESNASVKRLRALSQAMLDAVATNPARDDYRQGNTLGPAHLGRKQDVCVEDDPNLAAGPPRGTHFVDGLI